MRTERSGRALARHDGPPPTVVAGSAAGRGGVRIQYLRSASPLPTYTYFAGGTLLVDSGVLPVR